MKNHRLLTLPLLLMASATMAQTISEGEALDKALQFNSSVRRARGNQIQPKVNLAYKAATQDETYFYVFNYADGGFVIVGGDKAAHEILGYSDEGQFEYEKQPEGLRWMLGAYERQISAAIRDVKAGIRTIDNNENGPRKAPATSVAPLFGIDGVDNAIAWDQDNPYNLAIDEGKGKYMTGCVATAGGQVMRYYNYPSSDTGIRFERKYLGNVSGTDYYCPAITSDYTYNWSMIGTKYDYWKEYSLEDNNVKDVANLLYRLSRQINADYGTNTTSAGFAVLGTAMVSNFKYDKGMMEILHEYFPSESEWETIICDELKAGRPVLLAGQEKTRKMGHAFVCDGYNASDNTFHINWGWSGRYNGYFKMSGDLALTPNGTGNGGGSASDSYAYDLEALIGIQPSTMGKNELPPLFTDPYTLDVDYAQRGEYIKYDGFVHNQGLIDFTGYLGLAFVDVDNPSSILYSEYVYEELPTWWGYDYYYVPVPDDAVVGHKYYVYPCSTTKQDKTGWQIALHSASIWIPTLTVVSDNGSPAKGDANNDGRINVGDVVATRAHMKGSSPAGFSKVGADVNSDNQVNDTDVEKMRQMILGK